MYTLLANNQWKLFLLSSIDEVGKIAQFVDEIPPVRRLKEDKLYFLKLSLHELVTNAIIHGNRCEIQKKVTITLTIEPERILFSISDEGNGFTRELYERSITSHSSSAVGGRGLRLVSETMDEVSFYSGKDSFTISGVLNA